eukprot:scaffold16470_cov120-Isochrysis_galbana.AAC.2
MSPSLCSFRTVQVASRAPHRTAWRMVELALKTKRRPLRASARALRKPRARSCLGGGWHEDLLARGEADLVDEHVPEVGRLDLYAPVVAQHVWRHPGRLPVGRPRLRLEQQPTPGPESVVDAAEEAEEPRVAKVEMHPLGGGEAQHRVVGAAGAGGARGAFRGRLLHDVAVPKPDASGEGRARLEGFDGLARPPQRHGARQRKAGHRRRDHAAGRGGGGRGGGGAPEEEAAEVGVCEHRGWCGGRGCGGWG